MRRELALRRREAHVDDVEALLDGPAKPGEEHAAAAGEPRPEHANADELAVRSKRADDPRAGRPVAAEVALEVVGDDGLVVGADRDRNRALHLADERVPGIDAAVEDADPHALAGRTAPGPLARYLSRPLEGERDALRTASRQAPGWAKLLRRLLLVVGLGMGHRPMLLGSR